MIKDFSVVESESPNIGLVILIEKKNWANEQFIYSLEFQKKNKIFGSGSIFLKLEINDVKKFYHNESKYLILQTAQFLSLNEYSDRNLKVFSF